jgi:eukaryotic-like serine/threonine-protein kinase
MALEVGKSLGHYEILSRLGRGGMGEVWRARDTRLGREVAIKTLPPEFARDTDRLARFEREARLLASLNHPNIASIYGLEEHAGVQCLVLELVEGDTLEDRLRRGAIPVEESLGLALQILEALGSAHENGVIHRDLKPANIKINSAGKVKVLDFGLAKALTRDSPAVNLSQSPTLSMAATQQGVILGTAAYMSPEQARGVAADKRADIWAFGCVLFEMLTGRPVFDGELLSDVMASVLKSSPDYHGLPPTIPKRLRAALERCLEKDPKQRWHDVGDLRIELEAAVAEPADPGADPASGRRAVSISRAAVIALAALLAGGFVANWFRYSPNPSGYGGLTQFTFSPPAGTIFDASLSQPFALSHDGTAIAFVVISAAGGRELWIRRLDSTVLNRLDGTEGAWAPFWSPDDQWVGFYAPGALKRVRPADGSLFTMAAVTGTGATTAAWGPGGIVLFKTGRLETPFERVSFQGGAVTTATTFADGEGAHRSPVFLESGDRFLYSAYSDTGLRFSVGSLDGTPARLLGEFPDTVAGSAIDYAPGYLLYVNDETLWVREFDETTLDFGEARRLVEGVPVSGPSRTPFSVSRNTLAYQQNPSGYDTILRLVDRSGYAVRDVTSEPERYAGFAVSPDGSRIAYSLVAEDGSADVWVQDMIRGTRNRWTSHGDTFGSVWSRDGSGIAVSGSIDILTASGDGDMKNLTNVTGTGTVGYNPLDWGPDDRTILFSRFDLDNTWDLGLISIDDGSIELLEINSEASERYGAISPDGAWLAYTTDRSGQEEVWVGRMDGGRPIRVSIDGGTYPRWNSDGRELFYVSTDGQLMSVPADPDASQIVSDSVVPKPLFTLRKNVGLFDDFITPYAVMPGGQQFLVGELADHPQPPIHVVVNWPLMLED